MSFFRTTLKTKEKTTRYRIGFSSDQNAPRVDCVYFTRRSLRIRLSRISRKDQTSLMRARTRNRGDSEVRTVACSERAVEVAIGALRIARGLWRTYEALEIGVHRAA